MKAKFTGWIIIILTAAGLISSCSNKSGSSSSALILLSYPEEYQTKVSLSRLDTNTIVAMDSTVVKPGKTTRLKFHLKEPGFYLLDYLNNRNILVVKPGDTIFTELTSDGNAAFEGGAENTLYQQFAFTLESARLKTDSLLLSLEKARYTGKYASELRSFDSTITTLNHAIKKEAIDFIQQHPAALSQVLVINATLGKEPVFKGLADSIWYFYTDSALGAHFPENPHRILHHHRVQQLRQLAEIEARARKQLKPGSPAPEISLPDFSNQIRRWNDLPGTPTLLYFWAPTDALSRQANIKLKRLFEKSPHPGFKVFAVAFDPVTERWKAAVNLDKLWWTNVIDTLAEQSPLHRQYSIERLPVLIMLDSEGLILQRFISVEAFEAYLEKENP